MLRSFCSGRTQTSWQFTNATGSWLCHACRKPGPVTVSWTPGAPTVFPCIGTSQSNASPVLVGLDLVAQLELCWPYSQCVGHELCHCSQRPLLTPALMAVTLEPGARQGTGKALQAVVAGTQSMRHLEAPPTIWSQPPPSVHVGELRGVKRPVLCVYVLSGSCAWIRHSLGTHSKEVDTQGPAQPSPSWAPCICLHSWPAAIPGLKHPGAALPYIPHPLPSPLRNQPRPTHLGW